MRIDGYLPIADYALVGDGHSAALVGRDGSIDWLCLPRFDSPAVLASILDPDAGHWAIRPAGAYRSTRRYLPGTLVLETTFTTASGVVRLCDAMAFGEGERVHDLGRDSPHELLRLVEGLSGSVEMVMELAPRPEYGLVRPVFRQTADGGRTVGGPTQVIVRAGVPVTIEDMSQPPSPDTRIATAPAPGGIGKTRPRPRLAGAPFGLQRPQRSAPRHRIAWLHWLSRSGGRCEQAACAGAMAGCRLHWS
jgi:hypothetical protein